MITAPPGQVYEEATSDVRFVFSTGLESVDGPTKDRWGIWISALIPLHDPRTGDLIAVFGMDIDARDWQRAVLSSAAWPIAMITSLIALLTLSFALTLSRRRALDYQKALVHASVETEKQRRLLKSLLDAIPAPVFFKDRNRNYLICNPAFEAITGKTEAEILGRRPRDLWPEEFGVTCSDKDLELLKSSGKQQYELKYPVADTGEEREVIFYKSAFNDPNGEVDGIVGVMLDITERKQAEKELIRLKLAIEQTSEIVIITDPEGTIQFTNPAFEHITGYSRQEALGQNPRILKSGRQDQAFYRELWKTITSGKPWHGRMVNRRRDGSLYTDETIISPITDADGRIINYVALKRDITEHIRLSDRLQYAQKMETVGRLAGGVAHDFNNMLNVIIGHAELMLDELNADDSRHESLEEILGAARRSVEITRQLLAFARKQMIIPEVLDLNAVLAGMLKMLHRLIGENIELVFNPASNLWPIYMDPAQIDQILANLLINARDAIPGTGTVVIETGNVSLDQTFCADYDGLVPGNYVLLAVGDNGRGIDKKTLGQLFEPFFTTKNAAEGTGLGLATVYGIVKQNKGFVYAESEPGKGTTFRIYLPPQTGERDRVPAAEDTKRHSSGGEVVLIVEDEVSILKLTRRILERLGYTVLTATDPETALRVAEKSEKPIDLLITDVIMPAMNGRELTDRLKARHKNIRALFMSGYAADIIGRQGVLKAEVNFIQKPFSLHDLAAKARKTLDD